MIKKWKLLGFGFGVNTVRVECPCCKEQISSFPNNLPRKCPFCEEELDGYVREEERIVQNGKINSTSNS